MSFLALIASFALQTAPPQAEPPKQDPPKTWTLGKSSITFYGFLRLDVLYDTDRPNSTQVPGFILSEDLAGASGVAAGESDLTMHPRLTRFGCDLDGPVIDALGGAKLTGKLETDFYNLLPSPALTSNSREFLRMRHAWLKLAWEQFSVLTGQREDVIAPLAPSPNNDLVMFGAGNLADRRPQIRPEFKSGAVTVTGLIGLTGAVDNVDLDGNGFLDGESSGVPTLQGRVAYEADGWVEKKKIIVGGWAHWAQEKTDTSNAIGGEDTFSSTAFGVDITLPIHDRVWFKLEAWAGENLDDVRGGIFQGVAATGDEIASMGGWAELGIKVTENWTPILGASLDDPDDDDLPSSGRDKNLVFWIANRFKFGPFEMGADWLHWTTEFVGPGIDDGVDDRFNFFTQFNF